jgi:hypothetical protein
MFEVERPLRCLMRQATRDLLFARILTSQARPKAASSRMKINPGSNSKQRNRRPPTRPELGLSHHNPDATAIQAAPHGSGREPIEGVLFVPHHFRTVSAKARAAGLRITGPVTRPMCPPVAPRVGTRPEAGRQQFASDPVGGQAVTGRTDASRTTHSGVTSSQSLAPVRKSSSRRGLFKHECRHNSDRNAPSRHRAAPKILLNLAVFGQLGWKDKERSAVEKLIASGKQFSNHPARPAVSFLKLSFCEIFMT